ncbi:hypothetical protein CGLO_10815 [Colletotrichum gloeosporioides Cg-14]|uniref:Uncharacterized protein n=1 Tax=Colletotrichum gloeosporioides (strain Cg-14) TaxID=1237896 RepID=T0K9T1_COLGC|nr:hypothetical protein CGLO_10815 [Colletotrichum gloeosporioides Cg-14]
MRLLGPEKEETESSDRLPVEAQRDGRMDAAEPGGRSTSSQRGQDDGGGCHCVEEKINERTGLLGF